MKRPILLLLMSVISLTSQAQKDSSENYVKGFQKIPSFKIYTTPDSSVYTNANLKKDSPLMIVLFSPDCDHCQEQVKEFIKYKNELKDIQVLMISMLPYQQNKIFATEYGLAGMPNVTLGNDQSFQLLRLYKTTVFPAMYVYDRNGKLAKAFLGNIAVPAIVNAVK